MAWKQVVPSTLESDCTVRSVPHLVGKASLIFFPPRCPCDFGDGQKLDGNSEFTSRGYIPDSHDSPKATRNMKKPA